MQIVVEVRARRDQAVDVAPGDQVRDDQAESAGAERARHAEKDRHIVREHFLPDTVRDAERAPLKRDTLHLLEEFVRSELRIDRKRLDGYLQEAGPLFHAGSIVRLRRQNA